MHPRHQLTGPIVINQSIVGRYMLIARRGVRHSAAGIHGSSPGDPCGRMWPGMNGVLLGLVASGSCGSGAAVWRGMLWPLKQLVPGAQRGLAGARHRQALLQMTSGSPCRWCVCRAGLVAGPRSNALPHSTWWWPSGCGAAVPRGHCLQGGGGHPAEFDTAELRQVVEQLWLELSSLFSHDGLWTTKAWYPVREQGTWHCLCCDVRDREGFWPARETVYSSEAVLKSCRGRSRTD